jgi:FAD:protein FMN transferase
MNHSRTPAQLRHAVGVLSLLLLLSCPRPARPGPHRVTRLLMDTYVTISAFAPPGKSDKAVADAFVRLEEIGHKFNHLDSASPLYAFNYRNEPLTDSEIVEVIRGAQSVSMASGGAFDITVQPLVRLWGFYGDSLAVPSQQAIDSCLRYVGYRNLVIEGNRVTKLRPEVTIDLGGIAKGYALSEAARVLRADGVDSAVIDLGGDVYALGKKGDEKWRIGIRNPRKDGIIGVAAVSNLAVVTSGDYERFFFGPDSVRYCHIIDPRSGWPARGLVSTTVVMRDPILAQGWSKVLFVLGRDALGIVERQGGIEALLVTDSLTVTVTPGLANALQLDGTGLRR